MSAIFIGTFDCKADAKGRIMLPVALRNQMAPVLQEGFFVKKSYYSDCLELYPAKEWLRVMEELDEKSRFEEDNLSFRRMYTAGLRQVELDATGRLLIPKTITSLAGIVKEVKIAPMGKYMEIWDLAKYNESIYAPKEKKKTLANKVMSGKKE